GRPHFASSAFPLAKLGLDTKLTIYTGFVAVALNLIIAVIVTLIARAAKLSDGPDATRPSDYFADEGDPKIGSPPGRARRAERWYRDRERGVRRAVRSDADRTPRTLRTSTLSGAWRPARALLMEPSAS